MSSGSGYTSTALYFDQTRIGSGDGSARYTITTAGISTNIGDVIQITGSGTTSDGYYRVTSIPSSTSVAIAKTSGDPTITTSQYGLIIGPSSKIQSITPYDSATGISTFYTTDTHGLLAGNSFRVIDSNNNNLGDYIVNSKLGITSFTAVTNKTLSATDGYILKHGLSSNEAISDNRSENLGTRQVTFYDNETFKLTTAITTETTINITSSGIGTEQRLPLGSYLQIDNEIIRVTSTNNSTSATVLRGVLGTRQESHDINSLIRKINPIAIEFRRPSIIRASGHTFEYLGYGPGNYSTGLPQVQVRTLNDKENFLANSQERSCGVVVYTGMDNSGDFYNGNTKTSATSGEVISYDIPNPTVTGDRSNKLSVVFDEVTIKERLLVEGGESGQVLSQFDGPVTFNKDIRAKSQSTFNDKVRIISTSSDSLSVTGGSTFNGEVVVNTGIVPDSDEGAYLGTASKPFSDAHIGEVKIAESDDNTIETATGNLKINATTGSNVAIQTNTTINGNLDMTAGSGILRANYLEVPNITPVGGIVMWPGTVSNFPTGWAICNGAELPIVTYTALYNVLTNNGFSFPFGANTNGSGAPGSTHFRLPNMVDRFAVGSGNNYSVGNTGGSADAIVVQHSHGITDPGHSHTVKARTEVTTLGSGQQYLTTWPTGITTTSSVKTGITIQTSGVSGLNANLPPYYALIFIMRII
jgi:microcystin-dependent protein